MRGLKDVVSFTQQTRLLVGSAFVYEKLTYKVFETWQVSLFATIIRNEKESDGVALVESASNMPDATVSPRKMLDSSHMQMRNDPNTKQALNDLFGIDDEASSVHDFFTTNKIE